VFENWAYETVFEFIKRFVYDRIKWSNSGPDVVGLINRGLNKWGLLHDNVTLFI